MNSRQVAVIIYFRANVRKLLFKLGHYPRTWSRPSGKAIRSADILRVAVAESKKAVAKAHADVAKAKQNLADAMKNRTDVLSRQS
jgi:hypothetical protein